MLLKYNKMEIKGLIIIKHEFFAPISNDECISALPEAWKGLDRKIIQVAPQELQLGDSFDAPFSQIALLQRKMFAETIEPTLREHPGYKVIYFGLAPIPLAIDLGHQFNNFRDIEVFQLHHVNKNWYQETDYKAISSFDLSISRLPDSRQKGIGQLMLRMSISHKVKVEDTQDILPDAAEVDIELSYPNEDAITSKEEMNLIAEEFKKSMDTIASNESSLEEVHLFGSLPTGLAFLVGTKISPNIHPLVQTYQYKASMDPKYNKAILVNGAIEENVSLTEDEKKVATELRQLAESELRGEIHTFLEKNMSSSNGRSWYLGAVPQLPSGIMAEPFWANIPPISDTSLLNDCFDFDLTSINGGFFWKINKWFVDDGFFISLKKRLGSEEKIKKAFRLFLFHEALHYKRHKLGTHSARDIGSFPKVLETADYQADVYGLINEYSYILNSDQAISNPRDFFLASIDVATETMWSFDDLGRNLDEIQIRRLNRYINWYWQFVLIEKDGATVESIINILKEKPVIELNGLKSKEFDNRFFLDLNRRRAGHLEIAVFKDNMISRHGSSSPIPLESLIEGVKKMNGEIIKDVLRGLRDA